MSSVPSSALGRRLENANPDAGLASAATRKRDPFKGAVRPASLLLALAQQPVLLFLAALDLAGRAEVAELAVGPALASSRVVVPCAGLAVMWVGERALALRRSPMESLVDHNAHFLHLF